MNTDSISVISLPDVHSGEEVEGSQLKRNDLVPKDVGKVLGFSSLGMIAFCLLFAIPWTMIPRTNSMIYQSHWMEAIFPALTFKFLLSGVHLLNIRIWTEEPELMSTRVFLKTYLMDVTPFTLMYVSCYGIWSVYLEFNHPLPNLGLIISPSRIIFIIGLWFIFPSHLLVKKDFRRKLKTYMLYFVWNTLSTIVREGLTNIFTNIPSGLQFLIAFMVAGCREIDKRVRSKLVTEMTEKQDEHASALLAINVNSSWALYIAIRLVGSEWSTICCMVIIDFILHLKMTYQIIQSLRKVSDEANEQETTEKNIDITRIVLAELIEGFAPLLYGSCTAMAYYGPNAHIFSGVGNSYWSEKIEDIAPLLGTMFILYVVDAMSVVLNSVLLWKTVNVSMVQGFCRVLGSYWLFMAFHLAVNMCGNFVAIDINLGIDKSSKFNWISDEGRLNLICTSDDLTDEEKAILSGNITFI